MDERSGSSAHGGPITIGLRELYVQIQELNRSVAQLTAEMKMFTQQATMMQQSFATQLSDIRQDHVDHETRIRLIEARPVVTPRSMWTAVGVLMPVVSLIVTIVIAVALG